LPELKNPSENVEEPVLPNVPLVKLSAPEIPTPEPNLAFPLTPIPPATVKAPVVDEVDCVAKVIAVVVPLYVKPAAPPTVLPVPV